ncbi:hypothetical protein Tco_1038374 [Tanacetum coccineum]
MENPEQAFVDYTSPCTNKAGVFILNKEDEAKKVKRVEPSIAKDMDHERIEKEEDSEEELKKEAEDETEEEKNPEYLDIPPTINELRYHEWLLKNP